MLKGGFSSNGLVYLCTEFSAFITFWTILPKSTRPVVQFDSGLCKTLKWNESGFRPPLCTYKLNWARRTSWGWWDEWDDTVLQTQDSKLEPRRSEAEHATSRSRRLPTILSFTRGWGRNIFVSFKLPRPGTGPWTLACKAAVLTNHYPWAPRCELATNAQRVPKCEWSALC